MKTERLTEEQRYERRLDLLEKRDAIITAHRRAGRCFVQYACTRHAHSSDRQRARYARQIAAGQLNMEGARHG